VVLLGYKSWRPPRKYNNYCQAATRDPAIALDIILCGEVFPMTISPNPKVKLFYLINYKKNFKS